MFERFTDRARRVLMYSQEEAVALGHNYIGTEHILLGLLKEGEGIGALALQTFRLDVEPFREKVLALVAPMERPGAPSGAPPFTPRAKKVLELSLREALQLGHRYIGTEHILLGLVREGEGVAAQALVDSGLTLTDVRNKVISILSGFRGESASITVTLPRHIARNYLGWLKDFEGMVGALGPDHVLGELRSLMNEALDK